MVEADCHSGAGLGHPWERGGPASCLFFSAPSSPPTLMNITSLSSLFLGALVLGVCTTPSSAEPGYECFRPDEQVRSVFFITAES